MCPFRVAAIFACMVLASGLAHAQSDPAAADRKSASDLANKGDVAGALARTEQTLTRFPNDPDALFDSAQFNLQLRNYDAARGRAERLVRNTGSFAAAWELLTQIAQAQGDLKRRDEAIARLKSSIRSALDPEVRRKSVFIREIIPLKNGNIYVADYFDRGGSDYTRYQFSAMDPRLNPDLGFLLRTDDVTTESWSNTALLPPDKQLFHLDFMEPNGSGGLNVSLYQYYVDEPDFDTVNDKVMQILRGEVQPISGQPGNLAGVLKP
jgi:tetratricopeptide (TPR) repeat protein